MLLLSLKIMFYYYSVRICCYFLQLKPGKRQFISAGRLAVNLAEHNKHHLLSTRLSNTNLYFAMHKLTK